MSSYLDRWERYDHFVKWAEGCGIYSSLAYLSRHRPHFLPTFAVTATVQSGRTPCCHPSPFPRAGRDPEAQNEEAELREADDHGGNRKLKKQGVVILVQEIDTHKNLSVALLSKLSQLFHDANIHAAIDSRGFRASMGATFSFLRPLVHLFNLHGVSERTKRKRTSARVAYAWAVILLGSGSGTACSTAKRRQHSFSST